MKKYVGIIIASLMLAVMFLPFVHSESALADFSGGNGTAENPYIVTTVEQLQAVNGTTGDCFKLGNDINASETWSWNGYTGFIPLPTMDDGYFDGAGYNITNLYITQGCLFDGYSAFDKIYGISNLSLINITIDTYQTGNTIVVGGLVGYLGSSYYGYGSIYNCSVSGIIKVTTDNSSTPVGIAVGGLVGHAYGGYDPAGINITVCSANVGIDVITDRPVYGGIGGLVGTNRKCYVYDCYARGDINITASKDPIDLYSIGGLIGAIAADCWDSYSTGAVNIIDFPLNETYSRVGGLIGGCGWYFSTGWGGCDWCGEPGGSYCGYAYYSFWDAQTSGTWGSGGGDGPAEYCSELEAGATTAEMKTATTFTDVGWDFYTIWAIDPAINDGYPYLFPRSGGDGPLYGDEYVPKNLLAIPISSTEIALYWDMGTNTTETRIMGKTGGWPSAYNDANSSLVYEGSQTTVSHKNLIPGTTYYYRAWGVLNSSYSADYAEDLATTLMGSNTTLPVVPEPPWWFQNPSCLAYNQTPIFPLIQDLAASYDMPECTLCLLVTIFLIILMGILTYVLAHNMLVSLMIVAVTIVIASIAGLMPMWMLAVGILTGGSLVFIWSRA